MNVAIIAGLFLIGIFSLVTALYLRKLSHSAAAQPDLSPVSADLVAIKHVQEQLEKSFQNEIGRAREENAAQSQTLRGEVVTTLIGIGNSVTTTAESLTRSADQKLELLRTSMEQRLNSFSTDSARTIGSLRQEVSASSDKLHEGVSSKLTELNASLQSNVTSTHELHKQERLRFELTSTFWDGRPPVPVH